MEKGTVKSFDEAKGFGWIAPSDGTKTSSCISATSWVSTSKTLPIDAQVTFQSRTNDKGVEAINVSLSK